MDANLFGQNKLTPNKLASKFTVTRCLVQDMIVNPQTLQCVYELEPSPHPPFSLTE